MDGCPPVDGRGERTYVCHLDEATQEKARDELGEKKEERAGQIEKLRTWVKQQKHLTTRTDDHFLLRFLRRAKFSQLVAQNLIDRFTTMRDPRTGEPWFKDATFRNPNMMKTLQDGNIVALPGHDDEGRKVLIVKIGGFDPKDFYDHLRACYMTFDVLIRDERNCIHGFVNILDFSGFSSGHMKCMSVDVARRMMKCWQDTYPTRNKGVHYVNTSGLFDAVMKIFKVFMKEKTKNRLHFHGTNMESLHKFVPKRMLPKEYEGDLGPMKEVKEKWIEDVKKHEEEFELNEVFAVTECLRPKIVQDDAWGMTGSFRKLEV